MQGIMDRKRIAQAIVALGLAFGGTAVAAAPGPTPAAPPRVDARPKPVTANRNMIGALMNTALTVRPSGSAGVKMPPATLQVEPSEWAEIGQAFTAVMQVIRRSGERRAAYLAKLRAQGVEEEPMSQAGVAFEIEVLNNRFAFDKYGYLYFDDRFVKPEERPALKKVEALYRRFHKRWMKMKEDDIVDRAAEWRVRRVPIFRGFEDSRYQEHDALIVRFVDEFNRGKATWAGATPAQAQKIPALTTALVKSHMIEETGGRDPKSLAAWEADPQQVNVPGDWSDAKAALGLKKPSRRNEGTAEQNVKAAIRFLARKGFGVSGQPASRRPSGTFDDWQTALRRYNGRSDAMVDGRSYSETYADHIVTRAKNPGQFVAIRKKVKQ